MCRATETRFRHAHVHALVAVQEQLAKKLDFRGANHIESAAAERASSGYFDGLEALTGGA